MATRWANADKALRTTNAITATSNDLFRINSSGCLACNHIMTL
jgi:hypothetical protein